MFLIYFLFLQAISTLSKMGLSVTAQAMNIKRTGLVDVQKKKIAMLMKEVDQRKKAYLIEKSLVVIESLPCVNQPKDATKRYVVNEQSNDGNVTISNPNIPNCVSFASQQTGPIYAHASRDSMITTYSYNQPEA